MVVRIEKLENIVRILQRQVRALSKPKHVPQKEEPKEDSDYCPIS